tara:strand:+ start:888 stop:1121 length:234 start_codon:yes stop_codon:yes gene_type:complete
MCLTSYFAYDIFSHAVLPARIDDPSDPWGDTQNPENESTFNQTLVADYPWSGRNGLENTIINPISGSYYVEVFSTVR